jgi:hypothetical protein
MGIGCIATNHAVLWGADAKAAGAWANQKGKIPDVIWRGE